MSCHRDTARAGPSHKEEISFVIPHIKLLKEGRPWCAASWLWSVLSGQGGAPLLPYSSSRCHPYRRSHLSKNQRKNLGKSRQSLISFYFLALPPSPPNLFFWFLLFISSWGYVVGKCTSRKELGNADGLKFFFSLWFFSRQRFSV